MVGQGEPVALGRGLRNERHPELDRVEVEVETGVQDFIYCFVG